MMHRLIRRLRDRLGDRFEDNGYAADQGSSVLELSAVVTILGGVSALAVVTLTPLTADAVDVACRATQQTVRMAALAYETQSPLGTFAPSIAALVAAGYLQSTLPDVAYTVTATSFDVRGTGPCAT